VIETTPPIHKITNVRWKIVFLICVASFIAYILRTNLSIVGETMMRELGLTEIQLGYVFSAFAWGYALFQFPGGIFGDVVGSRKAITLMAAGWGLLTIFTGLIPASISISFLIIGLIAIRFLVGASQAPFFPVVGGVIANWFPVSSWGFPNGLTSTAATLGAAAVAPVLVWLLQLTGWRNTFLLQDLLPLLLLWSGGGMAEIILPCIEQ
jgi:ACS family glucarate transporter-like MFS transporter